MSASERKKGRPEVSAVIELLASMRRDSQDPSILDHYDAEDRKAIDDEVKALADYLQCKYGTTQSLLEEHFDASLDPFCVANTDGYFKRVNSSFAKLLGYTEQELLAQSFLSFIHPDDIQATMKEVQSLATGNLCCNFENRYRCKSGEYRSIVWQARPNVVSGDIFASGRDVTEQRRLETSLNCMMAALNETAIVAFMDTHGQIRKVNDKFTRFTGFSRTEILEHQHSKFHPNVDDPALSSSIWSQLLDGKSWTGDLKSQKKDGSFYWTRTVIAPVRAPGVEDSGYVSIQFDISEQKSTEVLNQIMSDNLKEAQSVAKIGSWSFDIASRDLVWSSEHYKICEISEPQTQEDLYRLYRQRIHKRDLQELDRLIQRAEKEGEGFVFNHRLVSDDGSIKYVKGIGKVTKDHDGRPVRISGTCQDITETVMREQESRYILDELGIGIWKWDLQTNSLEWDANMYRLYGVDPEDFNGAYEAWEQALSPETKARTLEEIMAAARGETDFDATFQVIQKNSGQIQAIRSRAFVIRDHEDKPIKMWGINIDRTREAMLELELTKTSKFLEQTGDLAKVGGWELDLKTGQVHMTRQTQLMHDIDEDYKPLPYSTGSEWYPPEAWLTIQSAVSAAIERGIPYDLESPFITAKGRRIWVRVQGFPLMEDGHVTRLRGTFQDISERKRAESDLAIFKAVLDNATDFVGIFSKAMAPIYINPAGRNLVGLGTTQDIEQTKLADYYPDDLRVSLVPLMEASMLSGGIWTGEAAFQHFKNNERIAVAATHFAVKAAIEGEILGYATISRDIRADKKLQREAQEASQQVEVERAKAVRSAKLASLGEMSAGIAHEINNPLTIIYGTVRVLPKFIDQPDQLASKIASIQSASERIAKIVRSLRKFSRTSDKSDYKVHSLSEIIREAIILTGAKAQRHATRIDFEPKGGGRAFCDEIEMEQVFVNLINNAIDVAKTLHDRWVSLYLDESDGRAIVRIRDSGLRISPEIQKKLFQPFFTTKPVGQGTGLGLSIVKGILDEHHATIEVLADDPHTCFEIRFAKLEAKDEAS